MTISADFLKVSLLNLSEPLIHCCIRLTEQEKSLTFFSDIFYVERGIYLILLVAIAISPLPVLHYRIYQPDENHSISSISNNLEAENKGISFQMISSL